MNVEKFPVSTIITPEIIFGKEVHLQTLMLEGEFFALL